MKNKKLVIAWAIFLISALIIPIVSVTADTSNISVKWYIPSDIGMSVAYPTALSDIEFRPTGQTFSDEGAYQQADGTYAFNVTNTGNVAIDIAGNFTADLPSGVTFFNLTTTWATPMWYWVPANDTSQQTIATSLAISNAIGYYANTSGISVANSSYPLTKTFRLTSSAS